MNQFLIFRTDRIGDFILTSILIKSIKRNNPNSKIIVICSKKNIEYIKKFSLVDEAIIYPNTFLKKISFYFSIIKKKIDYSLCLDGKKRSIFVWFIIHFRIRFRTNWQFAKDIIQIYWFDTRPISILKSTKRMPTPNIKPDIKSLTRKANDRMSSISCWLAHPKAAMCSSVTSGSPKLSSL